MVAPLAHVTRTRAEQRPGARARRGRLEREPLGLVVDPAGRRGGGRRRHRRVGLEHRTPALAAAALLDGLEETCGGAAHGDRVGMLDRQVVERRDHAQTGVEVRRGDGRVGHAPTVGAAASIRAMSAILYIAGMVVIAFVIGGLARFILPGKDPMGSLGTMMLGFAGSVGGGVIALIIFGGVNGAGTDRLGPVRRAAAVRRAQAQRRRPDGPGRELSRTRTARRPRGDRGGAPCHVSRSGILPRLCDALSGPGRLLPDDERRRERPGPRAVPGAKRERVRPGDRIARDPQRDANA